MSDERAYRVVVTYLRDKEQHVARIPELHVEARAATRSEAVSQVEHELEQRIAECAATGEPLPPPIDALPSAGPLTVQLADAVHRDLLHHARASNMSVEEYTGQLIARALGALSAGVRPPPRRGEAARGDRHEGPREGQPNGGPERGNERERTEAPPPRRDDREGRARRRDREGYRPELDDKANFLEYLRGLEKGPGRGRR